MNPSFPSSWGLTTERFVLCRLSDNSMNSKLSYNGLVPVRLFSPKATNASMPTCDAPMTVMCYKTRDVTLNSSCRYSLFFKYYFPPNSKPKKHSRLIDLGYFMDVTGEK